LLRLGSALALAASHAVSYFSNYLGRGEYLRVSPQEQMMSVYGRVIVLHITILGGAFVVGLFGTPIAALVLLVALKIAADLFFHLREHRRAQAPGSATA
jgi:Na+/H+-translocating membrane pyrophosphatase